MLCQVLYSGVYNCVVCTRRIADMKRKGHGAVVSHTQLGINGMGYYYRNFIKIELQTDVDAGIQWVHEYHV